MKGTCRAGDSCAYIHEQSLDDVRIPCLFFALEDCQNGDKCKFSHDKELIPNAPDNFQDLYPDSHSPKAGMELNAFTFGGFPRPNPNTIYGHLSPNPDPDIKHMWLYIAFPCTPTKAEPYHTERYYTLTMTSSYKNYR